MKLIAGGKERTTERVMELFIEKHNHSILLISDKKVRDRIVKQYREVLALYKVNENRICSVESLTEATKLFKPLHIFIDEAGSLLAKVLGLNGDLAIKAIGIELPAESSSVEVLPSIVMVERT